VCSPALLVSNCKLKFEKYKKKNLKKKKKKKKKKKLTSNYTLPF
jgi:hypothetical protein